MSSIAEVRQLTMTYQGRDVLAGVDLDVRAGEVLGLMGPNGGGKSTLLLTLAGLIRPSAGTVTVRGVPADQVALTADGSVGLITTVPGLYPLLTGWENLAFFGALYGLSEAEVRERVAPFLDELDLLPWMDARTGSGSSGMMQKISLARALLMDPPLLLLDEPTANLDPVSADVIFRAARAHADRGHAVVWVTHDLHAAERICDRIALIAGRLVDVITLDGDREIAPPRLLQVWRDRLGEVA